jgi:hypothetical protein
VGHSWSVCQCRYLRGCSAAQSDSAKTDSVDFGRSYVTTSDYEYLLNIIKQRYGLDLSADNQ